MCKPILVEHLTRVACSKYYSIILADGKDTGFVISRERAQAMIKEFSQTGVLIAPNGVYYGKHSKYNKYVNDERNRKLAEWRSKHN